MVQLTRKERNWKAKSSYRPEHVSMLCIVAGELSLCLYSISSRYLSTRALRLPAPLDTPSTSHAASISCTLALKSVSWLIWFRCRFFHSAHVVGCTIVWRSEDEEDGLSKQCFAIFKYVSSCENSFVIRFIEFDEREWTTKHWPWRGEASKFDRLEDSSSSIPA